MPEQESKKKKILCPECETETELTNGEGTCSGCGLDVGWVVEKHRRDKAVKKLSDREQGENNPSPRRRGFTF